MVDLQPIRRIDVLGVEVSAIDRDAALQQIERWVEAETHQYVCVRDVHGVMASQKDPELAEIHNNAGLVTPDGMPLVWCGRYAGAHWMRRVYGPDLMLDVCEHSQSKGWRHYLYGAGEGVADELAGNLRERFPELDIVGTHSPPFRELTDDEIEATAEMINAASPQIVWVGLSTPKQERWMARFRSLLDAPVLIGVGAAFDMHAGRVPQAPAWMQRSGLEWFYRLSVEPQRLGRRYLNSIPRFIVQIARRPPRFVGEDR